MSNYVRTTHTLSDAEYNRLRRQAREAVNLSSQVSAMATLNSNLTRTVNAMEDRLATAAREARDTRVALQAANKENEAKHEALRTELQNVIAGTDVRIDAARKEAVDAMNDMREEFNTNLVNAIESNNRNIEAAMNRNNDILNGRINALRDETNAALDEVKTTLNGIIGQNDDLLAQAREFREQTQVLQQLIGRTRHEILIPGGYQRVLDAIKDAETNIRLADSYSVNASVARNDARIAFEDAVRFYEEVRIAESEWEMQRSVAEQLAEVVTNQLENSRTIASKNGEELDIDFWSHGELSSHEETLDALRDRIEEPEKLSTDDLINIQSALRNVSENIENTCDNAYVAIINSQTRTNRAEMIRSELSSRGSLSVVDHAYEGDDKRGNYRFILRNPSGLLVAVNVSVNHANGAKIEMEADIEEYGNMPIQAAEDMVKEALESVSRAITEDQKHPDRWHTTETQCHNSGGVVCRPERADMNAWRLRNREGTTANTGNSYTNTTMN